MSRCKSWKITPFLHLLRKKKWQNIRCNEKKLKIIYCFNIIDVYRTFEYWKVLKGYEKLWLEYVSSATALQFYDNAYLRRPGQHRAEFGGKPWNYYGLDY